MYNVCLFNYLQILLVKQYDVNKKLLCYCFTHHVKNLLHLHCKYDFINKMIIFLHLSELITALLEIGTKNKTLTE